MRELTLAILNRQGLHAKPAADISSISRKYVASLKVRRVDSDELLDGKNMLDLLSLGAEKGTELIFLAEGEDEAELLDTLYRLIVYEKFGEE